MSQAGEAEEQTTDSGVAAPVEAMQLLSMLRPCSSDYHGYRAVQGQWMPNTD